MAGHSAWKNIKHRKAAKDAKRGKAWSKCARAIIVAARSGGGDRDANFSLRYAIEEARYHNMPRETIENAIKKGTGALGADNYESMIYEGYGPHGVAIMLDILTDNRNRASADIRVLFDRAGGNLGAAGCVSYIFQTRGELRIAAASIDEETIMNLALEAGAEDVAREGEQWLVITQPQDLMKVRRALEAAKVAVESMEMNKLPSMTVPLNAEQAKEILELMEQLEDNDDVQKVYANFEIPESMLA